MMSMKEVEERKAAIACALTWENTPFHDCANLKGIGVDCANLVYEAYHEAKLVPDFIIPRYTPQLMLHSDRELFLEIVELFCRDITGERDAMPGDVAVWRYGRCFSHGAIILDWPKLIHARKSAGAVVRGDALADQDLLSLPNGNPRRRRLYTLKTWS